MTAPYVFRRPFDPKVFGRRHGFTRPVYTKTASGLFAVVANETGTNRLTARPAASIGATAGYLVSSIANIKAVASISAKAGLSSVTGIFSHMAAAIGFRVGLSGSGAATYVFGSVLGMRAGLSNSDRLTARGPATLGAKAGINTAGGLFYAMAATLGAKLSVSAVAKRTAPATATLGAKAGVTGFGQRTATVSVTFTAMAAVIPTPRSIEYAAGLLAANSVAGIFARRTEKAGNDQHIDLVAAMSAAANVTLRPVGTLGTKEGQTASALSARVAQATIGARAGTAATSIVTLRPVGQLSTRQTMTPIIVQRSNAAAPLNSTAGITATHRNLARGAALIAAIAGVSAAAKKTDRTVAALGARAGLTNSHRSTRVASGMLGAILREQQPVAMAGIIRAIVGISASARITRAVARATLSELAGIRGSGGSRLRPNVVFSTVMNIPSVTVSVVYHTEALPGFTLTNAIARIRVLSNDLSRFGGVQFTRQD